MHEDLVKDYQSTQKNFENAVTLLRVGKSLQQQAFIERAQRIVDLFIKYFPPSSTPEELNDINFSENGFTMSFSGYGEGRIFIPFKYFYLEDRHLEDGIKNADKNDFKYEYHAG